jgi:hypothetical protein
MKSYLLALIMTLAVGIARGASLKATFDGQNQETKFPLSQLGANMPSDWAQYKFLAPALRGAGRGDEGHAQ